MPRQGRIFSQSGLYHVILRGVNQQNIFEDAEDKKKFFQTLLYFKGISDYKIYGYCFMDNHDHLLIRETIESISMIVKRISSSYVYWFNQKYERSGHLFQERFRSEPVETDSSLVAVLRYIHQNPVKAGLTDSIENYPWSSYREYTGRPILVDTDFVLNILSSDEQKAVESFREAMHQQSDAPLLDTHQKRRKPDAEVKEILAKHGFSDISQFQRLEREKRNEVLRSLKSIEGISIRQLSRIIGLSKNVIFRS